VLDLMAELRRELGVSYLFISRDLHTVRSVCDEIVVMQHGRKLAQAARADYDRGAHHPYHELLARYPNCAAAGSTRSTLSVLPPRRWLTDQQQGIQP
jgi:ABC-type glutathione transport system ATPase component